MAIKSEGVGETQQDLEGVEESMQNTAESAGDSAEELEGFSQRFQGAMSAAVAALAIGAAGLLSQVPVLGEAFAGLGAIVDAVAFQMDGVLRPALTPITNAFFEFANAIFEADGSLGDLIGGLGTIAASAGLVLGALTALGVTLTGPIIAAVGLAAAAAALLFTAWETNFGNIRGVVQNTVSNIKNRILSFAQTVEPIVRDFLKRLQKFWKNNGDAIKSIVNFAFRTSLAIIEQIIDTILTVIQAGLQLLTGDFEGAFTTITNFLGRTLARWEPLFRDVLNAIKRLIAPFVNDVIADVEQLVQDITNTLSQIPGVDVSGNVSFGRLSPGNAGSSAGGGIDAPRFRTTSDGGGTQIDGRQITESTGRYRSDPGRRRGL